MGPTQRTGNSQSTNRTHIGEGTTQPNKAKSLEARSVVHKDTRSGPTPAQSATQNADAPKTEHKLSMDQVRKLVTQNQMLMDKQKRYHHYKNIIGSGPEQAKVLVDFFRYEASAGDHLLGDLPRPSTFALALTILDTIKDPENPERQWAQRFIIKHASTKNGQQSINELKKIPNTTFSLSSSIDDLLKEANPYHKGRDLLLAAAMHVHGEYENLKAPTTQDNPPAREGALGLQTTVYPSGQSPDREIELGFQLTLFNYLSQSFSLDYSIEQGITDLLAAIALNINITELCPTKLNSDDVKNFEGFANWARNEFVDADGEYTTPDLSHLVQRSLGRLLSDDSSGLLKGLVSEKFVRDVQEMKMSDLINTYSPNLDDITFDEKIQQPKPNDTQSKRAEKFFEFVFYSKSNDHLLSTINNIASTEEKQAAILLLAACVHDYQKYNISPGFLNADETDKRIDTLAKVLKKSNINPDNSLTFAEQCKSLQGRNIPIPDLGNLN